MARLKTAGCVTWAGAQVQAGYHCASGATGYVRRRAVEHPPPQKKWAEVDLTGGDVRARNSRGGWKQVVKEDLANLRSNELPPFSLTLTGISCSGAYPCTSNNSDYNRLKALLGRVFRLPKTKGPARGVYSWLDQFVPLLLPAFSAAAMPVDEWIQTMPSRRRRALTRACELYRDGGWRSKYSCFKAFVKTEMLPDFDKGASDLQDLDAMLDRLIQGPHDVTHIIAGPILKPMVKCLKRIWSEESPIFYGSVGPEALHKWLQQFVVDEGTYFWCDYSMYDNTHSADSWAFLERLYRQGCEHTPDFWRVLAAWKRPSGRIGPFKYCARVMNASGRDDTALANALLNGFAAYLSACAAYLDVPLLNLTPSQVQSCFSVIRISVCGDDSLGRIPSLSGDRLSKFRKDMSENIAQFGFEAKLQTSDKLSDAVYLGMRPYPTRKGWFWGKTIGRSTYKMGWVVDKGQDAFAHIAGVADMHVLCSSHVPVLSDLALKIVSQTTGMKRTPVQLDPERPWEWTQKSGVRYDDVTLAAVVEAYETRRIAGLEQLPMQCVGITLEGLLDLIRTIESIPTIPFVLDHPVWRTMVWVDEL